jgi:hypothetical protein
MTRDVVKLKKIINVMVWWLVAFAAITLIAAAAIPNVLFLGDALLYGICAYFVWAKHSRVAGLVATISFFIGKIVTIVGVLTNPITLILSIFAGIVFVRGSMALFTLYDVQNSFVIDANYEELKDKED